MKTILIAAAELSARFSDSKGAAPTRHKIEAGTHITSDLAKKFGYGAREMEVLKARGFIVERQAHVVSEGDGPSAADLAAAEKRAADAEAKVAEHEKKIADLTAQLAEATKPASAKA